MDYAIVTETLLAGGEDVFIYKTMIQTPFCEKFSIYENERLSHHLYYVLGKGRCY